MGVEANAQAAPVSSGLGEVAGRERIEIRALVEGRLPAGYEKQLVDIIVDFDDVTAGILLLPYAQQIDLKGRVQMHLRRCGHRRKHVGLHRTMDAVSMRILWTGAVLVANQADMTVSAKLLVLLPGIDPEDSHQHMAKGRHLCV